MTNNLEPPHSTDDAFEQFARRAGAALRRPAPADGIARLRSARRRQQVVRTSMTMGASAIVVIVGLIALNRPSEETIAPSDSLETSTTTTPTTTTTPVTTTILASPSLRFTLASVDGLTAIEGPVLTYDADSTSLVSAWTGPSGIIESFIVLYETPDDLGRSEPDGDVTVVPIDVPDGRAYLVTANGADGQPLTQLSATRLMWWRGDGRLWSVSNYQVTPDRLTQLTLAIQPGSGLPYIVPEPGTTFVGFNTSESYEAVRQQWTLDGSNLTFGVTTGGLAQQLADVTAVSVVERTIAGAPGYAITLSDGQVKLTWPTSNPDRWASVEISTALSARLEEISAAITPL